ncbi:MAG: FAD-binding protein [Propionibacteriaceae bacterium]|jgi:succinate dehydrogenase/fumarate reductase flavoprotein subunit|nr:FAD-binding protein [Propionibacteriaceae bacterium]
MTDELADRWEWVRVAGLRVPVVTAQTVVVGTGAAGYCAAARLVDFGAQDVVMTTDRVTTGASRQAGSDKQTYYKLTLAGGGDDSVQEMARTLFEGGAMDGDTAWAEAALSTRSFFHLVEAGVAFPQNRWGEFVGYKTDHDPRQRATSAGPYTSRAMVEALEAKVRAQGTEIFDRCRVVDLVVVPTATGRRVVGLLVWRTDQPAEGAESPWLLFRCANLVYASGGPAGLYARSAYPHGQWGAAGAAYRAGAEGQNLTEWQFGLASLQPRWNVSGTYMQALPRFLSTAPDGGDEREFVAEAIGDYGQLLSLTFRKGYQWPFDVRRAWSGSSLIDLLVHRETAGRGRRVWLDFRRNPGRDQLDPAALDDEARDYLARAGALSGSPIERLRHMNEPAYQFYKERNPGLDLARQPLEIDLVAQHNNGGLAVDAWWRSNLDGFFPVGEASGAHGVYRPGGAALNSGQVGATRAAQRIVADGGQPIDPADFVRAAEPVLAAADQIVVQATRRAAAGRPDDSAERLRALGQLMSAQAGPVRSAKSIGQARAQVDQWLGQLASDLSADGGSRQSLDRTLLLRDLLIAAQVYLAAMADYLARGGRSRGSALYDQPSAPSDGTVEQVAGFRFLLDAGAWDDRVQSVVWTPAGPVCRWRPRRPLPDDDDVFENVWRDYRRHGPAGPDSARR